MSTDAAVASCGVRKDTAGSRTTSLAAQVLEFAVAPSTAVETLRFASWHPDTLVVALRSQAAVHTYNLERVDPARPSPTLTLVADGDPSHVACLATQFSRDSRRAPELAVGTRGGFVHLWDAQRTSTARPVASVSVPSAPSAPSPRAVAPSGAFDVSLDAFRELLAPDTSPSAPTRARGPSSTTRAPPTTPLGLQTALGSAATAAVAHPPGRSPPRLGRLGTRPSLHVVLRESVGEESSAWLQTGERPKTIPARLIGPGIRSLSSVTRATGAGARLPAGPTTGTQSPFSSVSPIPSSAAPSASVPSKPPSPPRPPSAPPKPVGAAAKLARKWSVDGRTVLPPWDARLSARDDHHEDGDRVISASGNTRDAPRGPARRMSAEGDDTRDVQVDENVDEAEAEAEADSDSDVDDLGDEGDTKEHVRSVPSLRILRASDLGSLSSSSSSSRSAPGLPRLSVDSRRLGGVASRSGPTLLDRRNALAEAEGVRTGWASPSGYESARARFQQRHPTSVVAVLTEAAEGDWLVVAYEHGGIFVWDRRRLSTPAFGMRPSPVPIGSMHVFEHAVVGTGSGRGV